MVTTSEIAEKIEEIAEHYGIEAQLCQATEELAELIVAINKYRRTGNIDNVIEEVADVEIMLSQLKYLLNISTSKIEEIKTNKIERQIERITKE